MKIISKYKYAKSSDQKLRLALKSLNYKNKPIKDILDYLFFVNKKSSFYIKKTIESAISNAEHNFNLNINDLILEKVLINKGPSSKKIFPRAKGRINYITKKTSHITVIITKKIN